MYVYVCVKRKNQTLRIICWAGTMAQVKGLAAKPDSLS